MNEADKILIVNEDSLQDMIFEIRGQKVMLDFDLARIYGYETRYFNRQVKNNIKSFLMILCSNLQNKNLIKS